MSPGSKLKHGLESTGRFIKKCSNRATKPFCQFKDGFQTGTVIVREANHISQQQYLLHYIQNIRSQLNHLERLIGEIDG